MAAIAGARALYPQNENQNFTWLNFLILCGICISFPLTMVIPQWASWESGPLERAQNLILLIGCWSALAAAKHLRLFSSKALLAIAALFWLAFLAVKQVGGPCLCRPVG